jgi:hypothetical protein
MEVGKSCDRAVSLASEKDKGNVDLAQLQNIAAD